MSEGDERRENRETIAEKREYIPYKGDEKIANRGDHMEPRRE